MDVFGLTPEARAFYAAAALAAAHELGLFARLDAPRSLAELASILVVRPTRLRALVDVLVLEGALTRDGDRLARGRVPPPAAVPREGWGRLAEVLRRDQPVESDAQLPAFHRHLCSVGAPAARELAGRLSAWARSLCDLGGGAGAYTAAFLDARPDATAILVDRPTIVELAAGALARYGARARCLAADLVDGELSGAEDAALLCNVLHLYDGDACRRLIGQATKMVRPGGLVVVKDLRIDGDRAGPPASLYFALNIALYTVGGDVHATPQLLAWLAQAGLVDAVVERLAAAPDHVVVRARKP